MLIVRTLSELPKNMQGGVIALGNFDGIHRGHQAVIATALAAARKAGVAAGVMTFEPHPRQFFNPHEEAFRLTSFQGKARLLEALGVDFLYVQRFDHVFSQQSPESFVSDILVGGLHISEVVTGFDYVFGRGRSGSVDVLRTAAARHGFKVTPVSEMAAPAGGPRYSSTNVRMALKDARPGDAAQLLGRYWEIDGVVQSGDQRGRTLGFPTANVPHGDFLRPAKGVYAIRAGVDEGAATIWHDGVANFGNRPTFDKKDLLLEVHLFDFSGDLYGRPLRVALVDYIRAERKFNGLDEIKAQIGADSETARKLLKAHGFPAGPAPYVAV